MLTIFAWKSKILDFERLRIRLRLSYLNSGLERSEKFNLVSSELPLQRIRREARGEKREEDRS